MPGVSLYRLIWFSASVWVLPSSSGIPEAESSVGEAVTDITVTISGGPKVIPVPDLDNMEYNQAYRMLQELGLTPVAPPSISTRTLTRPSKAARLMVWVLVLGWGAGGSGGFLSGSGPRLTSRLTTGVAAIAGGRGCGTLVCVNKWDLEPGEELARIYEGAGFPTLLI